MGVHFISYLDSYKVQMLNKSQNQIIMSPVATIWCQNVILNNLPIHMY